MGLLKDRLAKGMENAKNATLEGLTRELSNGEHSDIEVDEKILEKLKKEEEELMRSRGVFDIEDEEKKKRNYVVEDTKDVTDMIDDQLLTNDYIKQFGGGLNPDINDYYDR